MKPMNAFPGLCVLTLAGCLQPPTSVAETTLAVQSTRAVDARGHETAPDRCVRLPTFEVITNVALAALAPPIFLIEGELDQALHDDFSDPPLRVATQARLVATEISADQNVLSLRPLRPLAPGQAVTLVVAPWAVGEQGERWESDGTPFTSLFQVTTEADGGAAIVATWPADGAAGVPPNLRFAAIGFDGDVGELPATLVLEGEDMRDRVSTQVDAVSCGSVGIVGHECVRLWPERDLRPSQAYRIDVVDWTDSQGATIEPWSGRFVTAASADAHPPELVTLPCALDETPLASSCALISDATATFRMALNEPALVTATSSMCGSGTVAAFSAEARITVQGLNAGTGNQVRFDVVDAAGNRRAFDETIEPQPALATLTITEVRFDPMGPEPQQEYVELFNFGDAPIELQGYSLTDDRFDEGDVIEHEITLHPGGHALLVADDFDPLDARDITPPPGALLVRIGSSIANSGLSNSGEGLFLRDPFGTRVSETPSAASVGPGTCLQRRDPRARDGSIGSFVHDAAVACTPGR